MKRIQKIIILCLLTATEIYGQDPHFSQFYANPLYLNPAFAGSATCPRLIMNYRNQWPAIPGTFVTYNASYDQYFDKLSGGLGLLVNADDAGHGTLKTTTVNGIYSFSTPLNRHYSLKAAVQATYWQVHLDWSKLVFPDQIHPRYGFVYETSANPPLSPVSETADFSSGILVYGENIYAGTSLHHLTKPDIGFYTPGKLPMRFTAHFGGTINLKHNRRRRIEDPALSPNFLFMKQQDFEEFNFGLYVNKYPIAGGMWFRHCLTNPDALIVLLGLQTSVVKIGYSYDLTVSRLSNVSGGAHEISFTMQFACQPKTRIIRKINCPVF